MMRLSSAPLATASRAIAEKSFSGMPSGPSLTTSSSGPSDSVSVFVGTTVDAVKVTRKYTMPAVSSAANSARGKTRLGFLVSSATLTESSKPIRA
jgi:hypothetical protein